MAHVERAGESLRLQARYLDENHDLARGVAADDHRIGPDLDPPCALHDADATTSNFDPGFSGYGCVEQDYRPPFRGRRRFSGTLMAGLEPRERGDFSLGGRSVGGDGRGRPG